jgi:DNA-binding NarL/FixJ family response regulator
MQKRILVVDDHPMVREGIATALQQLPFEHILDKAASAGEVFSLMEKHHYNLCILDFSIDGSDGFEVLRRIKKQYSSTKVIVYTMHSAESIAARALQLGAHAFLDKSQSNKEFLNAVVEVIQGNYYVPPETLQSVINNKLKNPDTEPHNILSAREFQVLLYYGNGLKTAEIAEKLFLSPSTIRNFRQRIVKKLGLKQSSEIPVYAAKYKLIDTV